jgi:glucose-1-phosphate thymidylyltransferase
MSSHVGVILAAGRGKRMGALGENYPKALLPVANEPLISHHLTLLRNLGVRDVYVIVGHCATDLVQALGDGERYQVRLHYVEQTSPLGSAHALGRLRGYIRDPFLLILGDYYFSSPDPECLLRRIQQGESAIAAKQELNRKLLSEACELHVGTGGRIFKIVEKPVVPADGLKGCGFYGLQPEFLDAVSATPRTALRDEYELSVALQVFIEAGHPVFAEEIIDWDFNLTRPEDVLECNLRWLSEIKKQVLIAADANVDHGIRLEQVIVGKRCHIEGVSSLTDVVLFQDSKLRESGTIHRAIVTPREVFLVAKVQQTSNI